MGLNPGVQPGSTQLVSDYTAEVLSLALRKTLEGLPSTRTWIVALVNIFRNPKKYALL